MKICLQRWITMTTILSQIKEMNWSIIMMTNLMQECNKMHQKMVQNLAPEAATHTHHPPKKLPPKTYFLFFIGPLHSSRHWKDLFLMI
jgi:hypothetical protein